MSKPIKFLKNICFQLLICLSICNLFCGTHYCFKQKPKKVDKNLRPESFCEKLDNKKRFTKMYYVVLNSDKIIITVSKDLLTYLSKAFDSVTNY